eukprot:CAMPEP_0119530860 /NCGR_PEP_ID=MMETSP1344-20130328/44653_1 /TAXON_ID=236787 /ORGANISM="Florenciella parvula, Strain CCMP2471" /LENGTH=98 /DNA_ID=CAMNT_0007570957 /DNA_START=429 /DNA_END=725 /DNA_ORIENTATION=-
MELDRVVVVTRNTVHRLQVVVEVRVGGRDPFHDVTAQYVERRLDTELVLLAGPGRVKDVKVERILNRMANLFDREEHPADGRNGRDGAPANRVDESER